MVDYILKRQGLRMQMHIYTHLCLHTQMPTDMLKHTHIYIYTSTQQHACMCKGILISHPLFLIKCRVTLRDTRLVKWIFKKYFQCEINTFTFIFLPVLKIKKIFKKVSETNSWTPTYTSWNQIYLKAQIVKCRKVVAGKYLTWGNILSTAMGCIS